MPPKVLFTRSVPYAVEKFQRLCRQIDALSSIQILVHDSATTRMDPSDLKRRIRGCTGVFCLLTDRIDEDVLEEAGDSLRVVSTMSVGYNHIDVDACRKRNVQIGYTPGVLDISTAETTVALTFTVKRKILECTNSAKAGEWGVWQPFQYCGTDVSNCTVGIVGLGRIGTTYARMMRNGFNCKILYTGPNEKPDNAAMVCPEDPKQVKFTDLSTLLRQSDIVSLHLPLNEQTNKSFNAECFAQMKPSAVLINASRGEIVDQDALYEALTTNQIAGAGLDVTSPEPLSPSHKLFTLQNCTILPHIGSATIKTRQAMADIAIDNLVAGIQGAALPHSVF